MNWPNGSAATELVAPPRFELGKRKVRPPVAASIANDDISYISPESGTAFSAVTNAKRPDGSTATAPGPFTPDENGEPATAVKAPVLGLMVNAEMLPDPSTANPLAT